MFALDNRTENFLTFTGVKFDYHDTIQYSKLQEDWKTANLGREKALDQDAILEYGTMMENGSPAPAPIVVEHQHGFKPLDGVQRLCAAELNGATSFSAYVLSRRTSETKQDVVRVFSNTRINGQHTPSKHYVLRSAVKILYYERGMSAAELARYLGRPVADVMEEIRFQKTQENLFSIGYDGRLTNPKSSKWFMALVGKYADQTDWAMAPGPIKAGILTFDECKFINGAADHLVQGFFDVKRQHNKNRYAQFEEKVKWLRTQPEVASRLKRKGKTCPLDKIIPALRACETVTAECKNAEKIIHDGDIALQMADILRMIYQNLKAITPRDLQFQGNRNSSIYNR